MMTIIIFLIVLAVLVFVHELGHFLAAKSAGIRVDEFGIGFPPKIFSFKKGETLYSLNAIPFGGFVKIFGENPDQESIEGPEKERSFVHKPKLVQAWVLAAGVLFNIIFAWILLSIGLMIGMPVASDYTGSGTVENPQVMITYISPDSPAEKAGLKAGDRLIRFKDVSSEIAIDTVENVQNFINAHPNQPISILYERGAEVGMTQSVSVTPQAGVVADRAAIGIGLERVGTVRLPIHKAFYEGVKITAYRVRDVSVGLYTLLKQTVMGNANFSEVTGPVGIAGMVGDASRLGIVYLLSFVSVISINLAVINLVPFPALDGGRLLFVLIEKIKGSAISPRVANTFNIVGFGLLLLLMAVVTFQDVIRLIR
jgi:regulator of sigma E protease